MAGMASGIEQRRFDSNVSLTIRILSALSSLPSSFSSSLANCQVFIEASREASGHEYRKESVGLKD